MQQIFLAFQTRFTNFFISSRITSHLQNVLSRKKIYQHARQIYHRLHNFTSNVQSIEKQTAEIWTRYQINKKKHTMKAERKSRMSK